MIDDAIVVLIDVIVVVIDIVGDAMIGVIDSRIDVAADVVIGQNSLRRHDQRFQTLNCACVRAADSGAPRRVDDCIAP